jgi:hypothetical protein
MLVPGQMMLIVLSCKIEPQSLPLSDQRVRQDPDTTGGGF